MLEENEIVEIDKINELTIDEKSFLKSKTPASLPDNPSSKGMSASQIKAKMSDGFLLLFDWINLTRKGVNNSIAQINGNITYLSKTVNEQVQEAKESIKQYIVEYIDGTIKKEILAYVDEIMSADLESLSAEIDVQDTELADLATKVNELPGEEESE